MANIGKYEILRELGNGATSTVFLGLDPFNNQLVAIKRFHPEILHAPGLAQSHQKPLQQEVSLAGMLSHPHIVKVLDSIQNESENYMVMEYVEGESLSYYTHISRLLPFSALAEIIYKCCKALEYAEQQGVIHRDIKPANILLCGESDIKISDFGAAIAIRQKTTHIVGAGSPAYMSPEQVNEQALTHQTDIYSLGVTMYQLLTGKLPFEANNNFSLIYQIINESPPSPAKYRPDIPLALEAIVLHAMQKNRSLRYAKWNQFASDLTNFFCSKENPHEGILDSEKFNILRQLAFFKNFTDVELWEVLRISFWRKISKGELILREGAQGRDFYILGTGTVKVFKQQTLLNILNTGDCFGEMAHLSDQDFIRTTDVIADSDVTLICINPDALEKATTGCRFKVDGAFLRLLVERLNLANIRASQLPATLMSEGAIRVINFNKPN